MPQPHKGHRVKLTVRLPYDVYREAAVRAQARRWSLGEYISWCVENQHNPVGLRRKERADPTIDHRSVEGRRSANRVAAVRGVGVALGPDD